MTLVYFFKNSPKSGNIRALIIFLELGDEGLNLEGLDTAIGGKKKG